MNIYALKGYKVKCKTLSAGYGYDKEVAKKYLEVGKQYTVEKTEVGNWHTYVLLQEFPNVKFNSVFFEDAEQQHKKVNNQHPDYSRFN